MNKNIHKALEETKSIKMNHSELASYMISKGMSNASHRTLRRAISQERADLGIEQNKFDTSMPVQFAEAMDGVSKAEVRKEPEYNGNVLAIGDLHEPFCLDGYLEFCQEQYEKYNCTKVVFIGDVVDNNFPSYWDNDADGMGGGEELGRAIEKISRWRDAFPVADVTIGNHDRIIMRKAFSSKVPKAWIRPYKEVLGTPGWNFVDHIEIDGVMYIHGEGGTAKSHTLHNGISTVQGHRHTECYFDWIVSHKDRRFACQVGCGIDNSSYAMAYSKYNHKKPIIGCAAILDYGKLGLNILMDI